MAALSASPQLPAPWREEPHTLCPAVAPSCPQVGKGPNNEGTRVGPEREIPHFLPSVHSKCSFFSDLNSETCQVVI